MKPMLAHNYDKRGHNIKWPAYIQPKLDGVRALATRKGKTVTFTSRDGNEFPAVSHLVPFLLNLMKDGEVWDGELFTKRLCFEDLISAVKRNKTRNPNTELVEYWVYDCVMDNSFEQRHLHIDSSIKGSGPILAVPTLLIDDEDAMLTCHKVMISKGYEGTMIRNRKGNYAHKRSADLQKYKDMQDAEFKIIGAKQGIGKDKGCIVFVCEVAKGIEVDVRPNGSYARRERWWRERDKLMGMMLTVQFQGYTEEGSLRFPIGLEIRDYE